VNRDQILLHLTEAHEAIGETIQAIRADSEYDIGEFWVEMQHVYHHINTAWNSRDATPREVSAATDADFNRWSSCPSDLPMLQV
jgi:hypothetical protein